ncbi:MAG: hypothetical protein ACKVW3_12580 [Phycisphaerales bacterium]
MDVGLWQEQTGGTPPVLTPIKSFVLGTTRNDTGAYITLTRYGLAGGSPEASAIWPDSSATEENVGALRRAVAMVIPVVPPDTTAANGRIFVTGTTDAGVATTDIVVLCYDYNLNLKWMKTYNHQPNPIFYGDDEPVAIITDQTPEASFAFIGYEYVAVLGTSRGLGTGKDLVTLCFAKADGCELMPPQRVTSNGNYDDIAGDVCVGVARDQLNQDHSCIFVTGGVYDPANGNHPVYYTTGYLIKDENCLTQTSNGEVARYWPKTFRWDDATAYSGALGSDNARAIPVRAKSIKDYQLFITGTTERLAGSTHPKDMLTIRYDDSVDPTPASPYRAHQWNVGSGTETLDEAADMDVQAILGVRSFVAITGTRQIAGTSQRAIATHLYDSNLNPWWQNVAGTVWFRSGGTSNDRGLRVQIVQGQGETNGNSEANIFVTGRSASSTTAIDYVLLKYDSDKFATSVVPVWTSIPFYNNSSINGDDIAARFVAEWCAPLVNPNESRRIFVTGTSAGGTSGNDWATQFVVETR